MGESLTSEIEWVSLLGDSAEYALQEAFGEVERAMMKCVL